MLVVAFLVDSSSALSSHAHGFGHSPNVKTADPVVDAAQFGVLFSGESALFGGAPGSFSTAPMWMGRKHNNKTVAKEQAPPAPSQDSVVDERFRGFAP